MEFTDRLEEILKLRKISKRDFLEKIEMNKNQIQRWKKGESLPKRAVINEIAALLDVDPEYLTGESDIIKKDVPIEYTEQETELIDIFRSTTEKGRLKMIAAIMQIAEEIEKELESKSDNIKIG